ncbi:uncharacterized protein LOC143289159 isoform X2 [Babylonia areolata]|uniref:uncharacterized protein LOC143289159 isoform X2 n=1 Tax=Babylonia areolata TaxID=304850 RepID=UPI003FD25E5A
MAGEGYRVSPDVSTSQNGHKDEREENDLRFTSSYVKTDVPKKKTTFKITSVTKSSRRGGSGDLLLNENDLDLDDLDETADSHTEDLSSEIFDTNSRATDVDSQDPLLTPEEIVKESEPKEKPARFKVVKVETKEPFKRGRWVCCDYLDAPEKTDIKMDEVSNKPCSSNATDSVHHVHGIGDPSKNPLLAGAVGTTYTYQQTSTAHDVLTTANTQGEMFKPIQPALSSHTGLGQVSSQPGFLDQSVGQSVPLANRHGGTMPVLPPMQQGETQTSQSLTGNIPFPTPDGQSQQLPISQGSMIPSSGHSQSVTVAMSATSPLQPQVQIQEYVNAAAQGQISSSQGLQVPGYQQQMLYQDMSQQSGYSLSNGAINNAHSMGSSLANTLPPQNHVPAGTAYDGYMSDGSQLMVNGSALGNLTALQSEAMQDGRPNLGAGLAQIAVGGVTTAGPSDDDITEEAFLQYFSELSTYGSSGLFPPFLEESGTSAVAIDNKIEQAMDLVKSHLMFAVREEVEVLKEVIKELVERLHRVEQDNKLLRSEASPDTLSRLPPPLPPLQKPLLQLMGSLALPSSSSSS